ncbi:hypothetical protein C8R47DRAFT_1212623 [Mycena vitilis]|nr:hypothetical protein C8R47DRAFT_1212623 [Mycena vitilis]
MPYRTRAVARLGRVSAATQVWNVDELYNAIVQSCTLAQLARFRGLSRQEQAQVLAVFHKRVLQYTLPFFPDADTHRRFFLALNLHRSLIVGSVPLAVLSMPSSPACPDNLNLLAPPTTRARWAHSMVYVLHCTLLAESACTGPYEIAGCKFMRFSHPSVLNKFITITFASRPTVCELLFAAPNSNQWNAMSAHTLICPTVDATSQGEAVMGWWGRDRVFSENGEQVDGLQVTSPFPAAVRLYTDTDQWSKPCGLLCPGVPRFVRDLKGIGHWAWGGVESNGTTHDQVLTELSRSSLKWSIGEKCSNQHCEYGPNSQ